MFVSIDNDDIRCNLYWSLLTNTVCFMLHVFSVKGGVVLSVNLVTHFVWPLWPEKPTWEAYGSVDSSMKTVVHVFLIFLNQPSKALTLVAPTAC